MRNLNRARIPALSLVLVFTLANTSAFAQADISGTWQVNSRQENPSGDVRLGDYAGAPINDAARMRGDSWDPAILTVPEHQCLPHGAIRIDNFTGMRIWKEVNLETQQLIAYHLNVEWMTPHRVIWMDGRPHPPEYAAHTFHGFSTGKWEGNALVVKTTHLKETWFKRNGLSQSDEATLTERFIRHGNVLIWVSWLEDPVYLTEPFVRSTQYVYDPNQPPFPPYPCDPVEEINRPAGQIPHFLPGKNPLINQWATEYGIPIEAARGGAETMYPEYRFKVRELVAEKKRRQATR